MGSDERSPRVLGSRITLNIKEMKIQCALGSMEAVWCSNCGRILTTCVPSVCATTHTILNTTEGEPAATIDGSLIYCSNCGSHDLEIW